MRDCAIVIVTFNGWDLVRRCLESLEPELRPGIDVVIVDNGSTDRTPDQIRSGFPWASVIEPGRNLGFAAGNNLGIKQTNSRFVLLLNNDVIVRPGFVDEMMWQFDGSAQIGSVAATMVFDSEPGTVASAGMEVYDNGLALDRFLGDPIDKLTDSLPVFGASAGAAMFRREALDDVGLFPESFFMYLEDVDLAWRLRLRGWESVLSTKAIAEHAYSASSGEGSKLKRRLLARNRIWYVARCFPRWLLVRSLWHMLAYDLMVAASAPVRGDGASVRGRVAALQGLRLRLAERRSIQRRTVAARSEIEQWVRPSLSPRRVLQLREIARTYAARPHSSQHRND